MLGLRLAVAAIFIVHALPKIQKPEGMAAGMGWPKQQVQALGIVELVSALMVATGIGMHLGALAMCAVMVGAIYFKTQKWHVPFTATDKTGWELDVLLLACAFFLLTLGGWGIAVL